MPSFEYHSGRQMEKNEHLHEKLKDIFKFDNVLSDGSSKTKTDIFGLNGENKVTFSVKNVRGKNTQVHLTTLKKFFNECLVPENVAKKMQMWFGDNDNLIFKNWKNGKKISKYEEDHKRLSSHNIDDWIYVENWFNKINKSKFLANLLIGSDYIIWVNKNNNKLKIIESKKLIDYISTNCKWITMPSGTILRCVTPENKPILWLQMKGNRTDEGYNHNPQFHIVENWPEKFVEYEFSI